MAENISLQFVKELYNMSHEIFPDRVMEKVKGCFIDYLAVSFGGSKENLERNKLFLKENHFPGSFYIIGMSENSDIKTAAMINSFNAHTLELDDSHRSAMTHLGAPIFSALIGVAQMFNCTLENLFRAAVIGYEAAIRLGNAIQPGHKKRGFHVSGTCCTVGCALGIATMLDYSKEEMFNVLSAAATTAAGLLAIISGQSEQKPYNIANAAVAGINAALYGKYFHGAEDILGDSRGFLGVLSESVSPEKLFESGFVIEGIYQKIYASCRHSHAPVEAMLFIRKIYDFQVEDIKRVDVKTYDLAIPGHDHKHITGVSSAKQSILYCVAAACLYQDCGLGAFDKEKIRDQKLLKFMEKIYLFEDPRLSSLVPQQRAANVTVYLKNGKKLSKMVDYPKGEPENPISQDELLEKFYSLAFFAGLDAKTCNEIIKFIYERDSEEWDQFYQVLRI